MSILRGGRWNVLQLAHMHVYGSKAFSLTHTLLSHVQGIRGISINKPECSGPSCMVCLCVCVFSWCVSSYFMLLCCIRSQAHLLSVCIRIFNGSILYIYYSDCVMILLHSMSYIVVLLIQYSALFCIDSFCDLESAISGIGIYSSMDLTAVL